MKYIKCNEGSQTFYWSRGYGASSRRKERRSLVKHRVEYIKEGDNKPTRTYKQFDSNIHKANYIKALKKSGATEIKIIQNS